MPTGFIARAARRYGPDDGEPRRHCNNERFYSLFADEMLSNGEIGSDEKSSGVQTGNHKRTRASEKVFDGRERRIRQEHGGHERERSERSASDRGGGRTANMAAGAPADLSEIRFAFPGRFKSNKDRFSFRPKHGNSEKDVRFAPAPDFGVFFGPVRGRRQWA